MLNNVSLFVYKSSVLRGTQNVNKKPEADG